MSRTLTRRELPMLWRHLVATLANVMAQPLSQLALPTLEIAGAASIDHSVRRPGDDAPQTPAERKLAEYARRSREQITRSDESDETQPVEQERQEDPSRPPEPTRDARQPETPSTSPTAPTPSQPPNIDDESAISRLLSGRLRGDDGRIVESISGRLRSLKDLPIDEEGGRASAEPEAHKPLAAPEARLVFTAGPRAGEELEIGDRRLALDRDGKEALDADASGVVISIWAQGSRFMLRHGGIVVDGARPAMPVVTLEDGDELAWGQHRLLFRMHESSEPHATAP